MAYTTTPEEKISNFGIAKDIAGSLLNPLTYYQYDPRLYNFSRGSIDMIGTGKFFRTAYNIASKVPGLNKLVAKMPNEVVTNLSFRQRWKPGSDGKFFNFERAGDIKAAEFADSKIRSRYDFLDKNDKWMSRPGGMDRYAESQYEGMKKSAENRYYKHKLEPHSKVARTDETWTRDRLQTRSGFYHPENVPRKGPRLRDRIKTNVEKPGMGLVEKFEKGLHKGFPGIKKAGLQSGRLLARGGIGVLKGYAYFNVMSLMWDVISAVGNPIGRSIISTFNESMSMGQNIRGVEMGGRLALSYMSNGAATERQRALQAISNASINGRSSLGNEAQFMR